MYKKNSYKLVNKHKDISPETFEIQGLASIFTGQNVKRLILRDIIVSIHLEMIILNLLGLETAVDGNCFERANQVNLEFCG